MNKLISPSNLRGVVLFFGLIISHVAFGVGDTSQTNELYTKLFSGLQPIWDLILVFATVMGGGLMVYVLYKGAFINDKGSPGSVKGTSLVIMFFAASLLLSMNSFMDFMGKSAFDTATTGLSYSSINTNKQGCPQYIFTITVVQISGLIGLVKSLMMLSKPDDPNSGGFSGAVKVAFFAMVALNIEQVLSIVQATLPSATLADSLGKFSSC